jgi:endogenous inhibitor of DNA gyrase (YacG/DUF329 family)
VTETFKKVGHGRKCPICGRAATMDSRPFCSKRCADIDLGRWFSESYAVPAVEPQEGEELSISEDGDEDGY